MKWYTILPVILSTFHINIYPLSDQETQEIQTLQAAHQKNPLDAQALMNLASTLVAYNYYDEGLSYYQKAFTLRPDSLPLLYNIGYTYKKMGLYGQAQTIYEQVLTKDPNYAFAHFSLSAILLAQGNFERGWPEHEWRWKLGHGKAEKYNRPIWNGEDLVAKTLLVYAEQGLGDTLQFIRFFKHMKENITKHVRIIFQCQKPLMQLLKNYPYCDEIIPLDQAPSHCHYQIPLLSLPHALQTRANTIPTYESYIYPSENLIAQWKKKLEFDTNFKIGLCWNGNSNYTTAALQRAVAFKSVPLEQLSPLANIPGVSLYSLQRITGTNTIENCSFKNKLIVFDDTFDQTYGRFMDTAAVMKNMDLVISVDTGTCHLAGALGVPTWIMLPYPCDWRWLLNRDDSPWYPSVRLFRNTEKNDWSSTVANIEKTINAIINPSNPAINQTNHTSPTTPYVQKLLDTINLEY